MALRQVRLRLSLTDQTHDWGRVRVLGFPEPEPSLKPQARIQSQFRGKGKASPLGRFRGGKGTLNLTISGLSNSSTPGLLAGNQKSTQSRGDFILSAFGTYPLISSRPLRLAGESPTRFGKAQNCDRDERDYLARTGVPSPLFCPGPFLAQHQFNTNWWLSSQGREASSLRPTEPILDLEIALNGWVNDPAVKGYDARCVHTVGGIDLTFNVPASDLTYRAEIVSMCKLFASRSQNRLNKTHIQRPFRNANRSGGPPPASYGACGFCEYGHAFTRPRRSNVESGMFQLKKKTEPRYTTPKS